MLPRVPIVTSRPLRARNAEEKRKRRSEILRAAESLWLNTPYTDLSMSQVAREAQLAKGTLYLYFDTKEDLFLALLSEHLENWLQDLLKNLETTRHNTPNELADFIVSKVLPQESLRRLLILLSTVIDPSISTEQNLNFRRLLLRYVVPIVELMPYDRNTNLRILMHVYALALGWQLVASGPHLDTQPAFLAVSPHSYPRPSFNNEFQLCVHATIRALAEQATTQPRS